MEQSIYCRHCDETEEQDARTGVKLAMKGQRMIIATTTNKETDEDSEFASRVTRSMTDNFLRRPSVDDRAIMALASMANNDLCMVGFTGDRLFLCNAAFALIDRKRARFLISGGSAAYHFANGELAHRSLPEEASVIGSGPRYTPRMEPAFELNKERNAFLTASQSFAQSVADHDIQNALISSQTPQEWMDRLVELAGTETHFCAIAAFLPLEKPGIRHLLFRKRP